MSKKLFIIIFVAVFTVGAVVTIITAVILSPFQQANKAVKNWRNASCVTVTLNQFDGELICSVTKKYQKDEDCYNVTTTKKSLNPNPLDSNIYITEKAAKKQQTIDLWLFNLKRRFIKKPQNKDDNRISAPVKEKFIADFLGQLYEDGISNVWLQITYENSHITSYTVTYDLYDETYIIAAEFIY